jgi:hypothetical protein
MTKIVTKLKKVMMWLFPPLAACGALATGVRGWIGLSISLKKNLHRAIYLI